MQYIKENYGRIHISMPKDEINEIKKIITENGMSYVEFFRLCVQLLKEGKIKKTKN
jgi:predicted DNA binding CopG/RHH family protein